MQSLILIHILFTCHYFVEMSFHFDTEEVFCTLFLSKKSNLDMIGNKKGKTSKGVNTFYGFFILFATASQMRRD